MRLNIKNPNTEVFMYEKKSNTASIIVAIVAVLLILGGVYLINQSFNKPSDTKKTDTSSTNTAKTTDTTAKTTTTTPTSSSTSSQSSTNTSTDSSNVNNTNTQTSSTNTAANDTTNTGTTNSTTTPSNTTTTTTASTPTTLKEDEAAVSVTKVTPGSSSTRYDIEILDTGFPNGDKLKKGAKTYINVSGVTMEQGNVYLISSITEKDGKIAISSLTAKDVTGAYEP